MAQISKKAAVLIVVLVVILLFILGGCKMGCKSKDSYTRTCLRDTQNCQFVRTPVDYAMKMPPDTAWQRNPHWMGHPKDETQPLDFGPVDLFAEERKLHHPDEIFQQYGHNYPGCGNGREFIVNDEKTRDLLREVGDEGARMILDNMGGPAFGPRTGIPSETELSLIRPDPYKADQKLYGSYPYFFRDQLGS